MVLYWLAWAAVRLLATGLFRLRVSGAHHVPKTGGVLIPANHASYLDIPILGCGMPRRGLFIGRMGLFSRPGGRLMRHIGWGPIPRKGGERTVFEGTNRHARSGQAAASY